MAVAVAPLVIPAAEVAWAAIVSVGSALAGAVGIAALAKAIDDRFSDRGPTAVQPCPTIVLSSTYVPPPKSLPGFPDTVNARPKTPMGGGKLRKRWKTADGEILEWDYQHGKVEKYDKQGNHEGEFDPETGEQTKPPDPDRKVEP
jgi:hypothetical protein